MIVWELKNREIWSKFILIDVKIFLCSQLHSSSFRLPEWTKHVFVPGGDMEFVSTYAMVHGSETPQMARVKMGFLLREILDRFKMKIQSKLQPNRSIWMYSAHDSTVAIILNALGLFEVILAVSYKFDTLNEVNNILLLSLIFLHFVRPF